MPEPAPLRIVIADDHAIFRDGLRRLLETEAGWVVAGEAATGRQAIDVARALAPDVLLLDVAMPELGGIEALPALQDLPAKVVILTAGISEGAVLRALQCGARGIVLKEAATRQLIDSIRRVVAGEFVVGAGAVSTLAEAVARASGRPRRFGLTARERELVVAVASGASNKEIAAALGISLQTVKHHLTSIFSKTGVDSRLELALLAINDARFEDD